MVTIDDKKCVGCGACVKDCIVYNIKLHEKKAQAQGDCLMCGHCVAVCPQEAVIIDDYDMNEVVEYNENTFQIPPETLLNVIKFRRSIRDFKSRDVEKDKLHSILEAGRYTETGGNRQGVKFYVLQKELEPFKEMVWESFCELAEEMAESKQPYGEMFLEYCRRHQEDPTQDRLFFNAKTVILAASEAPVDAGLASANMELMAVSQGLGVLFDGYVVFAVQRSKKIQEWLSMEGKQLISCMLIGYPNMKYHRTVPRKKADTEWK